uniref:Cytochrome c oxidase assembly protein COX19 n=1 Tax=Eptatretus burgeri TaxID=7764 RepID=A0A8C4NEC9_EPTBU
MSTAMNFGSKSFKPRPPDKGAFPLDHHGECSAFKDVYMRCLRAKGFDNSACRQQSKDYLQCRMERDLMAQESLEKLGYKDLLENEKEKENKKGKNSNHAGTQ